MRARAGKAGAVAVMVATGALALPAAAGAAGPTATPNPTIRDFTAKPSQLGSAGGRVRLTALTTGARKCAISSGSPIKGLPTTIACPGGHPGITVTVPPNTGSSVRSIWFEMKAEAADGAYASALLYVHVLPPPAEVTSFTASTTMLGPSGGTVVLSGRVVRAVDCVISVKPQLAGFPVTLGCTGGTVKRTVTLPAATSGLTVTYEFALTAAGYGGAGPPATTTVYVTGKAPTVSHFTASPTTLPSRGGTVTLSVTVADASECGFGYEWTGGSDPVGSSLPYSFSCTSGTYTYKVPFAADTTKLADKVTFEMVAVSGGGEVSASPEPTVTEAAAG